MQSALTSMFGVRSKCTPGKPLGTDFEFDNSEAFYKEITRENEEL